MKDVVEITYRTLLEQKVCTIRIPRGDKVIRVDGCTQYVYNREQFLGILLREVLV